MKKNIVVSVVVILLALAVFLFAFDKHEESQKKVAAEKAAEFHIKATPHVDPKTYKTPSF